MRARLAGAGLLLLALSFPASAAPVWVPDGPTAQRQAGRLAAVLVGALELPADTPREARIEGPVVILRLGGANPASFVLTKEAPSDRAIVTAAGALQASPGLSDAQRRRVVDAVQESGVKVPWRAVEVRPPLSEAPPIDGVRAEAERIRRARARALRAGHDPGEGPGHHPGDRAASVVSSDLVDELGQLVGSGERLPVDTYLALAAKYPSQPKPWVAAALAAARDGDLGRALALADVATRMPRPDADALRLWASLTGEPSVIPEDAAEATLGPARDAPELPPWSWALAGALLVFAGWRLAGPRSAAGLALALVAAAWCAAQVGGAPFDGAPWQALPDALLAPLAGGECDADPALRTGDGLAMEVRCGSERASVILGAATPADVYRTTLHAVRLRGSAESPDMYAAVRQLLAALREAEVAGWRATEGVPLAVGGRLLRGADGAELALTAGLAGATLVLLPWLLWLLLGVIRQRLAQDQRLARGLLILAVVTVALHALAPGRLVMEYTGYDLVDRLLGLSDLPRYGAGGVWLYAPGFASLGADHVAVQLLNRVFGVLTLIPLLALTVVLVPRRRWGVWVACALFAGLPVVLRDHVSEGLQTGATLLLLAGLAAVVVGFVAERRRALLALAVPVLAFAATVRPEALVAQAGALAVIAVWGIRAALVRAPGQPRPTGLVAAGCALALLLVAHAVWLLASADVQTAEAGIRALSVDRVESVLFHRNLFTEWAWVGVTPALLVWVALGLRRPGRERWWSAALVVAALAWLILTAVDLPLVSVPRVHLPVLLLLIPVMARGVEALDGRWRWLDAAVGVAAVATAALSVAPLWTPSNAQAEDDLLRVAREHQPSCVGVVDFSDPPAPGKTQRHVPRYLFPAANVVGLQRLLNEWPRHCTGPSVVVLGTRCHMVMRRPGAAPPPPGELPICARVRSAFDLAPVLEERVPNRAAHTFPMYPEADSLDIGVYRIEGRRR